MATNPNANQITPPRVPLIDEHTGAVSREWYRWFYSLYNIVGSGLGVIPVASGGTGLSAIPTNGQLLIGNGTGYTINTLGAGVGISVINGAGTISIANTGVLSWSGGATGLTPSTAATGNVVLDGILIAVNGGTGQSSYAVGDLLYANTTTTLAKLPDVATGNALISGGVNTAPLWGKIGLTTHVSGVLPIANGGTNGTATPTAYGVAYGTGTEYAFSAAGTTGQVLTATTGGAPTWAAPATSGTVTSVGLAMPTQFTVTNSPVTSSGTLTAAWNTQTANYVLAGPTAGAAATPTFRALVAADIPALPYGTGTVTSVSFTGGIITVGTPTTTPALTVAGTSGGVPYFSSSTTWASSAALAANALVVGGGAGAAPATIITGTGVVTALGVNTGTAGAFVVNGGALGTPSSGTVTNLTGTASININGTVGATTPTTGNFTNITGSANAVIEVTDNVNAALRITQLGTGNAFVVEDSTSPDSTPFVIDANGKLVIGHSSVPDIGTAGFAGITLIGDSSDPGKGGLTSARYSNNATAVRATYYKSRGSVGTPGVLQSGDDIVSFQFFGDDGSVGGTGVEAARILVEVDGTPGTDDMPGRLVFSTTADGASSPTERVRIASDGLFSLQNNSGLSIARTSVTAPATTDGNVFSGTYTPSLTNTTNIAASTPYQFQYTRIGNVVTVSGRVNIDPTASATASELGISLPIASAFPASATGVSNLAGVGSIHTTTTEVSTGGILADTTNDRAQFRFVSGGTAARDYAISFTYLVV